MIRQTISRSVITGCMALSISACSGSVESNAVENYVTIVDATYQDTLTAANELNTAIKAFLTAPTPTTLDAAKKAWLAARKLVQTLLTRLTFTTDTICVLRQVHIGPEQSERQR